MRVNQLRNARPKVDNVFHDVMLYLSSYWQDCGDLQLELLEYEQYFRVFDPSERIEDLKNAIGRELLEAYRRMVIEESGETATEIMQDYTDLRCFGIASAWQQKMEERFLWELIYSAPMQL